MLGYPVIPWIGIMLTGYVFGQLYLPTYDAGKRKRVLIWLGLSAIVLFIIIRFTNMYGDPHPWSSLAKAVIYRTIVPEHSPSIRLLCYIS